MQPHTHQLRNFRKMIGAAIHNQRQNRHMTLRKLSRLCHIHSDTLDQYELGKNAIRLEELSKIAVALGIDMGSLLK